MDFLTADPPFTSGTPASTPAVVFESGGEQLLGVLHRPAEDGPHPIVVLLLGFPGNERNFDLAQALRRARYAALVFHYRGSWGVGGSWSWANVLADAARVVANVRSLEGLDPGRLAVLEHSVGGFAALMTAAADPVAPVEVHHRPLVKAYSASRLVHTVFPTDHALSDHRIALARTVVDFLDSAW